MTRRKCLAAEILRLELEREKAIASYQRTHSQRAYERMRRATFACLAIEGRR